MTLRLEGITKRFGDLTVVRDMNLSVAEGRVLGFLGSNGAGKTTTIRMILSILLPDEGRVSWRDQPVRYETSRSFGYLPEERGLYPKMKVGDQLVYLASLHGMSNVDATASCKAWAERLQIEEYWHKRVDQLSKGNQQKVQFAAAVAHNPPLVILDEPFSGLDPVNVQVLYESLTYLREQGVTILFSSHRLEAVEQMCTDVALIHKSKLVLSGELKAVKRQAGRQMVRLAVGGSFQFLDQFAGCAIMKETPNYTEIKVPASVDPQALLRAAIAVGPVTRFEVEDPSLEEIYLEHVRGVSA